MRIAFTKLEDEEDCKDVWVYFLQVEHPNAKSPRPRAFLKDGITPNDNVMAAVKIDESTFIKEMNITDGYRRDWKAEALTLWEGHFGKPPRAAKYTRDTTESAHKRRKRNRRSSSNKNYCDEWTDDEDEVDSWEESTDDGAIIVSDQEPMGNDAVIARFNAYTQPVTDNTLQRIAEIVRDEAETGELPPLDLLRLLRSKMPATPDIWECPEFISWRKHAGQRKARTAANQNDDDCRREEEDLERRMEEAAQLFIYLSKRLKDVRARRAKK